MLPDIYNNGKHNEIVNELFIKGTKSNVSLVFITQPYFKIPKDVPFVYNKNFK